MASIAMQRATGLWGRKRRLSIKLIEDEKRKNGEYHGPSQADKLAQAWNVPVVVQVQWGQ